MHTFARGALDDESLEKYADLEFDFNADFGGDNRLLGHPDIIQSPWEEECERVSRRIVDPAVATGGDAESDALRVAAAEWRLLLQLESDEAEDGPEWMWGDCGRIYYAIRESHLRAKHFDQTWLVLQCY